MKTLRNRLVLAATLSVSMLSAAEIFDFASGPTADHRARVFLSKRGIASTGQRAVKIDVGELNRSSLVDFRLIDGRVRTARLSKFEARGPNSFSWRGKLDDGGDALFTVHEGIVSAYIDSRAGIHQVVPIGGGGHALIRVNTDAFPPCTTKPDAAAAKFIDGKMAADSRKNFSSPRAEEDPVVDVSIIYTNAAKEEAGGEKEIESQVQSMIDTVNLTFENSKVPVRVKLVSRYEVEYLDTEKDTQSSFLSSLRDDETVAANRDKDKADLVALIVSRGEGEENGCGLAYLLSEKNQDNGVGGFSVTKLSCAIGNLTFAHELGHNFGAQHDPANAGKPEDAFRPYTFGHFVNGKFRTLMAYSKECADGCKRVPYLSSPEINYEGDQTGIAEERDNARLVRETGPILVKFRK